jgi:hypothetical protein
MLRDFPKHLLSFNFSHYFLKSLQVQEVINFKYLNVFRLLLSHKYLQIRSIACAAQAFL